MSSDEEGKITAGNLEEGKITAGNLHADLTIQAQSEPAAEQIDRLGKFISANVPGEPSRDEGAVDCAIRLILAGIAEKQNRLLSAEAGAQSLEQIAAGAQPLPYNQYGGTNAIDTPADRGTGRTREQIKAADRGAIFIWCNAFTKDYAAKLAESMGRHDVSIYPLNVLTSSEVANFIRKLSPGQQVIIDHAASLSDDMGRNLAQVQGRTGKPATFYQPPRKAEPAKVIIKPEPKLIAAVIPWSITGTGIIVRDERGQQLGRLKLTNSGDTREQGVREASMDLMELCARRIALENTRPADVAPQHVESRSAGPTLDRIEAAHIEPSPAIKPSA